MVGTSFYYNCYTTTIVTYQSGKHTLTVYRIINSNQIH